MSWLTEGVRVAWIGDSHSEALGPRMARSLPTQTGATFVRPPVARRGWSVRRYARSGDVPSLVAGSDVVIIELGGNDAMLGANEAEHARDVAQLLEQVGSRKVIWIGPGVSTHHIVGPSLPALTRAQARVVGERSNGVWLDGRPMTRSGDLAPDKMHFRSRGYDHWAAQLTAKLAKVPEGKAASRLLLAMGVGLIVATGVWWWRATR